MHFGLKKTIPLYLHTWFIFLLIWGVWLSHNVITLDWNKPQKSTNITLIECKVLPYVKGHGFDFTMYINKGPYDRGWGQSESDVIPTVCVWGFWKVPPAVQIRAQAEEPRTASCRNGLVPRMLYSTACVGVSFVIIDECLSPRFFIGVAVATWQRHSRAHLLAYVRLSVLSFVRSFVRQDGEVSQSSESFDAAPLGKRATGRGSGSSSSSSCSSRSSLRSRRRARREGVEGGTGSWCSTTTMKKSLCSVLTPCRRTSELSPTLDRTITATTPVVRALSLSLSHFLVHSPAALLLLPPPPPPPRPPSSPLFSPPYSITHSLEYLVPVRVRPSVDLKWGWS